MVQLSGRSHRAQSEGRSELSYTLCYGSRFCMFILFCVVLDVCTMLINVVMRYMCNINFN